MPNFDPITGEPLKPDEEKQKPAASYQSIAEREKKFIDKEKAEHPFLVKFFSMDNPLWTLIPILISLTALFFAYRSTTISREVNDVHLRVTALVVTAYPVPDWNFMKDGHFYCPGVVGGAEDFQKSLKEAPLATAINALSIRWGMKAAGLDLSHTDLRNMPYVQHYHYLCVSNDSSQIAQDFRISMDYYPQEDNETLRGRKFIPDGVGKQTWEFGPAPIAGGQTVLFPLGTSYIRYDPTINDPSDLYRNFDVQYFGEFYYPLKLSFSSNVSGRHEEILNLEKILPVTSQFSTPPEGPVGERAKEANLSIESKINRGAEDIVRGLAPEGSAARQDTSGTDSAGGDNGSPPAKKQSR